MRPRHHSRARPASVVMAESTPRYRPPSIWQRLFYRFVRTFTLALFKVLFGLKRRGMGRVPRQGALLLVCNHQSYLDPPAVGVSLPRVMHPVARASLFDSPKFGWFIRMLNAIPIREDGQPDAAAIRLAIELLEQGRVVLVFPEGQRTNDGDIGEFKRGAGLLLRRSKCAVAPVAIVGAYRAWPRSRSKPKLFRRIGVRIGEPIPHDELMEDGVDVALDRLRREVIALRNELQDELSIRDRAE